MKRNIFVHIGRGLTKRTTVVESSSTLLILLFIYAATTKLLDYDTFRFQLGRSPFVEKYSAVIAWFLPIAELITAALLIINKTKLLGLYASLFLMSLFTFYIYAMLHYSYYTPCSCGGILSKMSWDQHLWFNIAFTLFSLLGIYLYQPIKKDLKQTTISKETQSIAHTLQ